MKRRVYKARAFYKRALQRLERKTYIDQRRVEERLQYTHDVSNMAMEINEALPAPRAAGYQPTRRMTCLTSTGLTVERAKSAGN